MQNKVTIRRIDSKLAKSIIETNHYSHTIPQAIKYRFGLLYDGWLLGVAIFSIPANRYSITSAIETDNQSIGIELSRVWTCDDSPKNFESCALALCFKEIRKQYQVLVSYADPNFNHQGYLYQALNGLYIGQTNPEPRYLVDGKLITRRGLGRSKGDTEKQHVQRLLAQGASKVKMKGKHKYIWLFNKKLNLKVPVLPYPKNNEKLEQFSQSSLQANI
jgi:hypothetical protein